MAQNDRLKQAVGADARPKSLLKPCEMTQRSFPTHKLNLLCAVGDSSLSLRMTNLHKPVEANAFIRPWVAEVSNPYCTKYPKISRRASKGVWLSPIFTAMCFLPQSATDTLPRIAPESASTIEVSISCTYKRML